MNELPPWMPSREKMTAAEQWLADENERLRADNKRLHAELMTMHKSVACLKGPVELLLRWSEQTLAETADDK